MKKFRYIQIAAAMLIVASCTVEEQKETVNTFIDCPVFVAEIEPADGADTKVYADENLKVLWHENDRVSIFNKLTYNQQYRFDGNTGDNSGPFGIVQDGSFVTGNELDYVYAVYPYSADIKISNSGVLTINLPATQVYAAGSFGPGANAMVAVAGDNELAFKNLCGYLMFKLYGDGLSVSSIKLTATGGEALAGTATVNATPGAAPAVEVTSNASNELVLECSDPVALGATADSYTEFWFAVPPVTMSQGFSIFVTLSDGRTFEKSSANSVAITRNRRSRIAPVEVVPTGVAVPPNNEIWYTSTDGQIVTPYKPEGFNTSIVSNTYSDGKGIIRFDGDLTSIGHFAFTSCKNLKTLILPNKLESIGSQVFSGCRSLETLNIPESVTSIETYGVFAYCEKLESFTGQFATADGHALVVDGTMVGFAPYGITEYTVDESVTVLGTVFLYCKNLIKLNLPSGLLSINHDAIEGCSGLTELILPESLKSIGNYVFRDCTGLKALHIPQNVVSIGKNCFDGCSSLSSFTGKFADANGKFLASNNEIIAVALAGCTDFIIPEGITKMCPIGPYNGLETVVVPSTINTVGQISKCYNMKSIVVKTETPPTSFNLSYWYSDGTPSLFAYTNDCPIFVPKESVVAYKTAQYWSDYADRIQAIEEAQTVEAVDLGLSVKWASCNVGATKPEDYGDYFAWGETETHYEQGTAKNPVWKPGEEGGYSMKLYKWWNGSNTKLTKYCTDSSYWDSSDPMDNKTVLDPGDDAAHVNWGGSWRMATEEEWTELIDNCTWTWVTREGIKGRLVTGPNGNSIFLPAGGRLGYTTYNDYGTDGYYWSSSLNPDYPHLARYVDVYSSGVIWGDNYRFEGFSVRPVEGAVVPVSSVDIQESLDMIVGETASLYANISPSNATYKSLTWVSSDTSVATVSNNGVVSAVGVGQTTVHAYAVNGCEASCTVTVGEAIISEAIINIDGSFDDWTLLEDNNVSVATCSPDVTLSALKTMKVYADSRYIYVYIKFDPAQVNSSFIPFQLYVNDDNDAETGGCAWLFSDASVDVLLEGYIWDGSFIAFEPGAYLYTGTHLGDLNWSFDTLCDYYDEPGIGTGAGSGDEYEIRLDRQKYPRPISDDFSIGACILKDWDVAGILPNASASINNPSGMGTATTLPVHTCSGDAAQQ